MTIKVEIQSKNDNKALERKEIEFSVNDVKATPSRKELREQIAALTNSDKKNIIVDVLNTSYGTTQLTGEARVYENHEKLKQIELKPIVVRNFGKEEKKGEKKEEEKPAEAGQEKKEEVKAEEKKKETPEAKTEKPKKEAKAEKKE